MLESRRLWAMPNLKPIERKRYVAIADDLAILLGIGAMGGGASWLANANREGGESGYDLVYPSLKSWDQLPSTMKYSSDFINTQLQNMLEGKAAPYLQDIGALQKKISAKSLANQYLGDQFSPGNLQLQTGYDVARGLGKGGASTKAYGGQLQKWTEQSNAIDDYINQYVLQGSANFATQMPQLSNQLSSEMRAWGTPQVVGYNNAAEPNVWDAISSILGGVGAASAYGSGTSGVSSGLTSTGNVGNTAANAGLIAGTTSNMGSLVPATSTTNTNPFAGYTGSSNVSGYNPFAGYTGGFSYAPSSTPTGTNWNQQQTNMQDSIMNNLKKRLPWLASSLYGGD